MAGEVALGLDVGGSSIKYAPVDTGTGQLLAELASSATPQPATADNLMEALARLAAAQPSAMPVGIALPSVIRRGVIYTASNLHPSLIGLDAGRVLAGKLGRQVVLLNDADAAGIAEVQAGAARDVAGTVMLLTFGTGIGSALFIDGRLVPNTELGHMEVGGAEGEQRASARVRTEHNLGWPEWTALVNEYLDAINRLFWPELIVIGGGVSEHYDQFAPLLRSRAELRVAHFGAAAGAVGAAMAAVGHSA
ncbi:MAG TPA: ROK family protein [Steroidobacteraceae bacterium]|nr:ROK family protein [Steroidobacteraceae bacterium]